MAKTNLLLVQLIGFFLLGTCLVPTHATSDDLSDVAQGNVHARAGREWVRLGEYKYGILFYDRKNLTYPKKNVVGVWIKAELNDSGATQRMKSLYINSKPSYSLFFCEIDCSGKFYSQARALDYGGNGNELHSWSPSRQQWLPIAVEDGPYSDIEKQVCKPWYKLW